jgi:DNA helicase-2/ATP-dependent DNA helicase PcrA
VLQAARERLGVPSSRDGSSSESIRAMTIHGAKGLSASVVFVPGLTEQALPGPRRRPYPGLVSEAARMLYVAVTRARAACVMSYPKTCMMYGAFCKTTPSRFTSHLGGCFVDRAGGLTVSEADAILQTCDKLR